MIKSCENCLYLEEDNNGAIYNCNKCDVDLSNWKYEGENDCKKKEVEKKNKTEME